MVKISKFGGTSVGSAGNMQQVARIVENEGTRITVLSAMSGTTDALVKIGKLASEGASPTEIEAVIASLKEKYTTCIELLLKENRSDALEKMNATWRLILDEAASYKANDSERAIVAQGELLTSAIFTFYMNESGRKAVLLHAPDFMEIDADGKVKTALLKEKLAQLTADSGVFYITQGFICTNHEGRIDNLGRGGSDFSAALIGAAIAADEVQIWTDIDGMHNNDPRFVSNTYPIRQMSFDEAAELAYFGAKILHPATIQPCKELDIPVKLKNTMEPEAPGTTISSRTDNSKIFRAVAAKDGITVIRIYSLRMLMAYGFLRKVFEVFEKHRTPIDMITTSEVAVSLTVDNDSQLDKIVSELEKLGTIEIERDNSIVCIVGELDHSRGGLAAQLMNAVDRVPIKMISYGASHRSLALLVETKNKKEILQNLNDKLFCTTN